MIKTLSRVPLILGSTIEPAKQYCFIARNATTAEQLSNRGAGIFPLVVSILSASREPIQNHTIWGPEPFAVDAPGGLRVTEWPLNDSIQPELVSANFEAPTLPSAGLYYDVLLASELSDRISPPDSRDVGQTIAVRNGPALSPNTAATILFQDVHRIEAVIQNRHATETLYLGQEALDGGAPGYVLPPGGEVTLRTTDRIYGLAVNGMTAASIVCLLTRRVPSNVWIS